MLNMFSYGNNVRSTLSAPLAAGATTASLHGAPAGANNPSVDANESQPARFTIMNRANNPTQIEIIEATGVSGLVLGVVTLSGITRGVEGTTARAWPSGSIIVQSVTAGMLNPLWARGYEEFSPYQEIRIAGQEIKYSKHLRIGNKVTPVGIQTSILVGSSPDEALILKAEAVKAGLADFMGLRSDSINALSLEVDGQVTAFGKVNLIPSNNSDRVTVKNLRIQSGDAPASASAQGMAGDIRVSGNYIYVCTSTNTWRRATLASW